MLKYGEETQLNWQGTYEERTKKYGKGKMFKANLNVSLKRIPLALKFLQIFEISIQNNEFTGPADINHIWLIWETGRRIDMFNYSCVNNTNIMQSHGKGITSKIMITDVFYFLSFVITNHVLRIRGKCH